MDEMKRLKSAAFGVETELGEVAGLDHVHDVGTTFAEAKKLLHLNAIFLDEA